MKKEPSIFTKRCLFSVLLLFLLLSFNCQEYKQTGTNSNEAIIEIIDSLRFSKPDEAKLYANILLKNGKRDNDTLIIIDAYKLLGKIEGTKGNFKIALDFNNQGLNIARLYNDNDKLVELLMQKGTTYLRNNKDKNALETYIAAQDIAKKGDFSEDQLILSCNIAFIKQRAGKFEEAIKQLKRNLVDIKDDRVKKTAPFVNLVMMISDTYLKLEKSDSALFYNRLGLKWSTLNNDEEALGYFYTNFGIAYHKLKKQDSALYYLFKAERNILDLLENPQGRLAEPYLYIGLSYKEQQDYDKAIDYLKKVLELRDNKRDMFFSELEETYKNLAFCYEKKGNLPQSNDFYKEYVAIKNEIEKSKHAIKDKLYNEDIENLETEVDGLSYRSRKMKYYLYLILGISIFIICFLIYRNKRILKENEERFKKLIDETSSSKRKENQGNSNDVNNRSIGIEAEKVVVILQKLEKLMDEEYYLKNSCSLHSVAKKIKTNTRYLSKIINIHLQKNFNTYINDLRISYVVERLQKDKMFRKYTISSIANEIGFKSTDSFTRYFKKTTGLNPSFFVKKLNDIDL